MPRFRLLRRRSLTAGGIPALQTGGEPYFVANPLDTGAPVSSVVVGQRQFIYPGNFTNSPSSYDWEVYDATRNLLGSGADMAAAGDDYWLPSEEHAGLVVDLETVARNSDGVSLTAVSSTKTVGAIDLSGAAPVLTRTSITGASPFTVTMGSFTSAVYENYAVQRALATSNTTDISSGEFLPANVVYDETVYLDASTLADPNSIAWPAFDDSSYTQLYEMRRVIATAPAGTDYLSPWSNMVQKSDALTNSTAYSKYRVRTTNTGNGFATIIAEFKVAAVPGGADTANNSGVTISGTSSADTNPASNARDGNPSTYWSCNLAAPNTTAFPHDLILDYSGGTAIAANEFQITAENGTAAPRNFTIDGWDGSTWVQLRGATSVTWTSGETKTYVL